MTTDKIEDCVSSLITISHGDGTLQQKLGNAESRICGLLLDADAEVGGWYEILRDLLDRLGNETNAHNGSTREFLNQVVYFIHNQLKRVSVKPDGLDRRSGAPVTVRQ